MHQVNQHHVCNHTVFGKIAVQLLIRGSKLNGSVLDLNDQPLSAVYCVTMTLTHNVSAAFTSAERITWLLYFHRESSDPLNSWNMKLLQKLQNIVKNAIVAIKIKIELFFLYPEELWWSVTVPWRKLLNTNCTITTGYTELGKSVIMSRNSNPHQTSCWSE